MFNIIVKYIKSIINKPIRFNLTFLVFILILYKIKHNINLFYNQNSVILVLISFILYYIFAETWVNICKKFYNLIIETIISKNFVELNIEIFNFIKKTIYNIIQIDQIDFSSTNNFIIEFLFIIILILISLWLINYSKYIKTDINYKIHKNKKKDSIHRLTYILLSLLIIFILYYYNNYFKIDDDNFKYLNKLLFVLLLIFIFSEDLIIKLLSKILDIILAIIFIFL